MERKIVKLRIVFGMFSAMCGLGIGICMYFNPIIGNFLIDMGIIGGFITAKKHNRTILKMN